MLLGKINRDAHYILSDRYIICTIMGNSYYSTGADNEIIAHKQSQ